MHALAPRLVAAAVLALACCVIGSRPAYAHGGGWAPPPPPESPPAPSGAVAPPSHVDPGFGGPIVTPVTGGGVGPQRASKRKAPLTVTLETSWQLWWDLHRDAFLAARVRRSHLVLTGPGAEARPGGGAPEHLPQPAAYEAAVRQQALPLLLRIADPASGEPPDVVASACLALGKIAPDGSAADVLLARLEDGAQPDLVRESAALALGLLRRSQPEARLPAARLDVVRSRLLKVFDSYGDGGRVQIPVRTRAFAMYAVALLGDQPFQTDPLSRDGRLISKLLWERLAVPYPDRELHVALLAALGRQPAEGQADGIQEALREVVLGKTALGHRWDLLKRAHAVATIARSGGVGGESFLLRLTGDARQPLPVRMAAALATVESAPRMSAAARSAAVRMLTRSFDLEQELLGAGLANIALGRMVGADLQAGSTRVLEIDRTHELLLKRAADAPWYLRGHALVALGLAAAPVGEEAAELPRGFRTRAATLLAEVLRNDRAQPSERGAAAVALGLMEAREHGAALQAVARRSDVDPEVRSHAALALGQLGDTTGGVVELLADLVRGSPEPRVSEHAALALSLLGAGSAAPSLLERLGSETATRRLAAAACALGRLGDLGAVGALVGLAGRAEARPLARAMALVALGRLLDPEPRPSLLRLTFGACYPARTPDMQELFTIL